MTEQITNLPITSIRPGANDRRDFDRKELAALAANIGANGLAQPITVRPVPADAAGTRYEIVAGERRWRAHQILNAETIPALVRALTDEEASAIMLAENVARADLNPIEEAHAYIARVERFDWTVDQVARAAGKSTVHVLFRLKLLDLREDLQKLVADGQLPLGYAQIVADADLDTNFQLLALRALREAKRPTPQWFRGICGDLAAKQAQSSLFDLSTFARQAQEVVAEANEADPPTPETTTPEVPQVYAGNPAATLNWLIGFWKLAAEEWEALGKSFKRNECLAAATALEQALAQF